MSENKCPCCGDSIGIFPDSGFWECDNCTFMCALEDFDRIAAVMKAEARHNALVEAVKWERKAACAYNAACASDGYGQMVWATENLRKARDEVDKLLKEEL